MYMEIASSGKTERLGCPNHTEAWEEIVRKNQEANGSFEFDIYFNNSQTYALLFSDYIYIKAALMKLSLKVDVELVKAMNDKGYKISMESSEQYAKSIYAALRKSENLITKVVSKQKELNKIGDKGKGAGFEQVMANLSFGLGFTVPDDLTLSRYNEYRKILKAKFKK